MNRNAANALLKALEEPPSKVILLLVSHNPGNLLPTIRSRCRKLVLSALNEENFTRTRQRIRMILNTRLELARLEYWNALNTVRRVQQW